MTWVRLDDTFTDDPVLDVAQVPVKDEPVPPLSITISLGVDGVPGSTIAINMPLSRTYSRCAVPALLLSAIRMPEPSQC